MLTFSFDELLQIERTLERVYNAVSSLADKETAQQLSLAKYIVAEVRHCSNTLDVSDELLVNPEILKTAAVNRLVSMIKQPMPTDADYLAALGPCNK